VSRDVVARTVQAAGCQRTRIVWFRHDELAWASRTVGESTVSERGHICPELGRTLAGARLGESDAGRVRGKKPAGGSISLPVSPSRLGPH